MAVTDPLKKTPTKGKLSERKKSLIHPATFKKICRIIRETGNIKVAANCCGLNSSTIHTWLRKGGNNRRELHQAFKTIKDREGGLPVSDEDYAKAKSTFARLRSGQDKWYIDFVKLFIKSLGKGIREDAQKIREISEEQGDWRGIAYLAERKSKYFQIANKTQSTVKVEGKVEHEHNFQLEIEKLEKLNLSPEQLRGLLELFDQQNIGPKEVPLLEPPKEEEGLIDGNQDQIQREEDQGQTPEC